MECAELKADKVALEPDEELRGGLRAGKRRISCAQQCSGRSIAVSAHRTVKLVSH